MKRKRWRDLMPQLNKGGKYVFGLSEIKNDYTIQIPEQAIIEYNIVMDKKIIVFTGTEITGGFCATNNTLLSHSKLKHILDDCSALASYKLDTGEFIRYKGRGYSWFPISPLGIVHLTENAMNYLDLTIGDRLMCIRSSDIAFTMGARGPLMDKVYKYKGEIDLY